MYIEGFGNMTVYSKRGVRLRTVCAAVVFTGLVMFYAGQFYNAYRQIDVVLPTDVSVQRSAEYWSVGE